jgi:hypothetical protein
MKKWIVGVGSGLIGFVALSVPKEPPVNRYQGIAVRNVFGLTEVPAQQTTNVEAPVVLPKLFLTGITTVLDRKMAMFRVQYPAKPGEPAKEESLMLAEGQRDGPIEVIRIDEKAKEVKVSNSGSPTSLNFDKDGVKTAGGSPATAAAAGPGAVTANPAAPGAGLTATGTNFSPASIYPPQPPPRPGLSRTLRLPNTGATAPAPPGVPVNPPPSNAALGVSAAAAQNQAAGVAKQLTPEEEQLLRLIEQKTGHTPAPQ